MLHVVVSVSCERMHASITSPPRLTTDLRATTAPGPAHPCPATLLCVLGAQQSHNSEQRMVTTTKNLISEISSNQEALQKFKKRQEDLQGVKRRLEEETAKTFNEVSATHKVVLEKRKRANELAASMERLEAMLAGGSGWTDDQKEQKVSSAVCAQPVPSLRL